MKKTHYILLSLLFVLSFFNQISAQITTFYEGDYKPAVIWVFPREMQQEVHQKINELSEFKRKKYHFLLIPDSTSSKATITKTINDFLNSDLTIEKQRIYFLEWGALAESQYFKDSKTDIIADLYYFQITGNGVNFKLDDILKKFDSQYIWQITLSDIEEKSLISYPQFRKFSYGLSFGTSLQNTFKTDSAFLPSSISKLGFTVGYRINPRLNLIGRVMFSFKIPDQSGLQSTLLSQINIAAGGKQTVSVDMKSHIFLQGSLQVNYFLTNNKKIKPFVGAGFSAINFKSAKIHQEVEINLSSLTSSGGLPTGGLGGLGGDLPFFSGTTIDPFVTAGLSLKLTKHVSLISSAEYHYNFRKELNGVKVENRNFSFNTGLQFEFTKRQRKYYRYLE